MGSYSGAMYNGDFSMTLDQAQNLKHEFIAQSLNIKKGSKVLDMGCGWSPFLKFLKDNGTDGIGVTLSKGQVESCRKNGLNVHLMDCKSIKPETFGQFDAIASIGGFEHFCSVQEWKAGKQDEVYNNFFKVVYDLLPLGGKFYMQTMVFSKNMINYEDIDINADKKSDAYVCALVVNEYPNSWLPYGVDQIIKNANSYFKLIHKSSGRLDYIETTKQWKKKFLKFNLKKYALFLSLIPLYMKDKKFRYRVAMLKTNANRICFEREIFDHFRFVFKKV